MKPPKDLPRTGGRQDRESAAAASHRLAGLLLTVAIAPVGTSQSIADAFEGTDYPGGLSPRDVLLVDVDGDGLTDLVTVDQFASTVNVAPGLGDGSFGVASLHPVGFGPVALAAGDLDADGDLDLVTANSGAGSASVLLGAGDGSLLGAIDFACGSLPQAVALGDVDGDGALDVAVAADSLSTPLCLLYGSGDGDFQPAVPPVTGFCAAGVAVADLDDDGGLDLVLSSLDDDAVVVLRGLGSGAFADATVHPVLADPRGLDVGDLNGDGWLDVVVADSGSDAVSVLLGRGSGDLFAAVHHDVGAIPYDVDLADLDGDEVLDVLVADFGSNDAALLLGRGDGDLDPAVGFAAVTPMAVATGDVDGDHLDDFAVANVFAATVSVYVGLLGPWIDLGGGVAGSAGEAVLVPYGTPVADAAVGLAVEGLPPGYRRVGFLMIGLERIDVPFQGGTLVPDPLVVTVIRPAVPVEFRWPSGPQPGSSVYSQAWFEAVGRGTGAATGTGALRAVVQDP